MSRIESASQADSEDSLRGSAEQDRVYIVVLNWNGWRDTLECLESVFRLGYPHIRVIVCDNNSSDGSVEMIEHWAAGSLEAPQPRNQQLAHLISPALTKPLQSITTTKETIESDTPVPDAPLTIIRTGANLGFAGGNNVALRFLLQQRTFRYVWLLNNDTVVPADSLTHLVRRMEQSPEAGICGSMLLAYDHPQRVQACAGSRYNAWTSRIRPLGFGIDANRLPDQAYIERNMDYVVGASMLVSRHFLETVGLMSEDYFLYYEEIDWATRARRLGLTHSMACSTGSFVYHKEGSSIGSGESHGERSDLSERFNIRNRILFTRRYYPAFIVPVLLVMALTIASRAIAGNLKRARLTARSLIEGLTCPR